MDVANLRMGENIGPRGADARAAAARMQPVGLLGLMLRRTRYLAASAQQEQAPNWRNFRNAIRHPRRSRKPGMRRGPLAQAVSRYRKWSYGINAPSRVSFNAVIKLA
jgi:hypothetical protein